MSDNQEDEETMLADEDDNEQQNTPNGFIQP